MMTKTHRLRYSKHAALVSLVTLLPNPRYAQTLREQIIGSWKFISWTRTVDCPAVIRSFSYLLERREAPQSSSCILTDVVLLHRESGERLAF